jgi:hypothetical protein
VQSAESVVDAAAALFARRRSSSRWQQILLLFPSAVFSSGRLFGRAGLRDGRNCACCCCCGVYGRICISGNRSCDRCCCCGLFGRSAQEQKLPLLLLRLSSGGPAAPKESAPAATESASAATVSSQGLPNHIRCALLLRMVWFGHLVSAQLSPSSRHISHMCLLLLRPPPRRLWTEHQTVSRHRTPTAPLYL